MRRMHLHHLADTTFDLASHSMDLVYAPPEGSTGEEWAETYMVLMELGKRLTMHAVRDEVESNPRKSEHSPSAPLDGGDGKG